MMKKLFLTLMLGFLLGGLLAQIAPNKYFVQFTDKNGTPYSLENPQAFLTQRAIDRRINQGIPMEYSDLPVNPAYADAVAATGATVLYRLKWFNGVTIQTSSQAVLDAINELPFVAGISKSSGSGSSGDPALEGSQKPFFAFENYNQSAPLASRQLKNSHAYNYGSSYNQIQMIKGADFHDMGYRGQGMVIAVLDAGFLNANTLPVFDSLWLNGQILGTRDFVKGGPTTFDDHAHGTMVLSTMGGNVPGELIGTAPLASYWLLRSEDGGTEYLIEEYNWVAAAEFADSVGADIINSSLGYTTFDDPAQNHTYADMDGNTTPVTRGADLAARKGILVFNSLGNSGTSSWFYLSAPSDGDSVMGIGAVDPGGNYVSFSSRGPSFDGRVKPDAAAQGSGVYVANPYGGGYTTAGGTSFSSPIMAGMGACLWQSRPEYNNMQIAEAIRQTGSRYTNPDDKLGYGIPDFIQAYNILTVIDAFEPGKPLMRVFPNPVRMEVNLVFSDTATGKGRAEVYDLAGKTIVLQDFMIVPGGIQSLTLPEGSPSGMYFLKLTAGNQVVTQKIIKN